MRTVSRGFTLIELMVVVAIIGILSSVAIPSYRVYQLRTKQAERAVITRAIKTGIDDYQTRADVTRTSMYGAPMPSRPAVPHKRSFVMSGDWRLLNLLIEGHVYYSYVMASSWADPTFRYSYVLRYGDLDGDRRENYSYEYWPAEPQTVSGRVVWVERESPYDDFPFTKTF